MDLMTVRDEYGVSTDTVLTAYDGACADYRRESRHKLQMLGIDEVLAEIDRRARLSVGRSRAEFLADVRRWPFSDGVEARLMALTRARLSGRTA